MKLTDAQRQEICAEEARYQLTIMEQYLSSDDRVFFLRLLNKYENLLAFERFLDERNLRNFWEQAK